jgi:hypothetical protein
MTVSAHAAVAHGTATAPMWPPATHPSGPRPQPGAAPQLPAHRPSHGGEPVPAPAA